MGKVWCSIRIEAQSLQAKFEIFLDVAVVIESWSQILPLFVLCILVCSKSYSSIVISRKIALTSDCNFDSPDYIAQLVHAGSLKCIVSGPLGVRREVACDKWFCVGGGGGIVISEGDHRYIHTAVRSDNWEERTFRKRSTPNNPLHCSPRE